MIPEITPVDHHAGNDAATEFQFNFYIEKQEQLLVFHTDRDGVQTLLEYGVDYSVHEVGNEDGSYITFPIAGSEYTILKGETASGKGDAETLDLCLTLAISQEAEYGTSITIDFEALEYSFDYLTRLIQIQERKIQRSVKVQEGKDVDTDVLAKNVNTLADNLSIIQAVNNNATNINAVNSNKTNIDTVAGISSNVSTVAGISEDVTTVAGIAENVTAVKNNATNINSVAGISSNVSTVAGISEDVTTVADIAENVTAVKNNATNINSVAGDLTNINLVAGDLTNIDNASTYATTSKQYAVGLPAEPTEGSAKYWAERAAQNQIQSNWLQSDNTKKDFIKNKPTALSDFTDDLGTNPAHTHSQYLTSHQDISGKEDVAKAINILATSGTIALTDNSVNSIAEVTGDITFTLPTVTDNTKFHQIAVQMSMPTAYSIDMDLGTPPHWLTEEEPDLTEAGNYNLYWEYDKAEQFWRGAALKKGAAS